MVTPPPPEDMNLCHPEEMKEYESSPVGPNFTISVADNFVAEATDAFTEPINSTQEKYILYEHVFVLTSFRNGH